MVLNTDTPREILHMKWLRVKQLMEYFQDHSSSDFQDLVDMLSDLSSEQIDEYNEMFSNIQSNFFEIFMEAVLAFDKFETAVENGGLISNNYINKHRFYNNKDENSYYMDIISYLTIRDIEADIKQHPDAYNKKFIAYWNKFKHLREELTKLYGDNTAYVHFTAQDFSDKESLFKEFIETVRILSTYDLHDHPSFSNDAKYVVNILHSSYKNMVKELKHIIKPNKYYTTSIWKTEVYQRIDKLASLFIKYQHIRIHKIAQHIRDDLLFKILGDVEHNIENQKDEMSDLRFSSETLKLFRQIEQNFVELAEIIDIM